MKVDYDWKFTPSYNAALWQDSQNYNFLLELIVNFFRHSYFVKSVKFYFCHVFINLMRVD